MKQTGLRTIIGLSIVLAALGILAPHAVAQPDCDSVYQLLQNFSVNHIRGNEIWVDQFISCQALAETLGGFVLSMVDQEGKKDRAILCRFARQGWLIKVVENAPNIRFYRPSPIIDINGDGENDFLFTSYDPNYPLLKRAFKIVIMENGKEVGRPELRFAKGVAIDSLLPAAPGKPHPLRVSDYRGTDLGGMDPARGPVSHRYLVWDKTADPPAFVNRTAQNMRLFPEMIRRAKAIKNIPSGKLTYSSEDEYEALLRDVIGYALDQSNLGREIEGYDEVASILDRVTYGGSTKSLWAPRSVRDRLRTLLPKVRKRGQVKKK